MSIEQRNCLNSDPQVTKRLFTILVLMIGFACIFGGYLLGRMARKDAKRNELLTVNLTIAAENLYKKAMRLTPKAVHNHDAETIRMTLVHIFDCMDPSCATIDKYNLGDFIRNSINLHVTKLMKSVYNVSLYLDTLR